MIFKNGRVGIIKCTASQIDDVWPVVSPWLEKCLDIAPPFWTLNLLRKRCDNGHYICWLVTADNKPCAVALSELEPFDDVLVCNVPWIGGSNKRLWRPFLQQILESWARDAGAKHFCGAGRRGWSREAGMNEIGVILHKDL